MADGTPCCPVCHARFRGAKTCSRCGADLTPLMLILLRAQRLRELAREALTRGDYDKSLKWTRVSLKLYQCEEALDLEALAQWCLTHNMGSTVKNP